TERVEPSRRNEAASARLGPGTDRCAVDHTVEDADERLRRASLEPGQVADEAVPRRDRDVLDVNDVAGVDLFRDAMNGEADVFGVVERERPHRAVRALVVGQHTDRKSTRLNSSHDQTSYAVFCLKKKNHAPAYH